MIIKEKINLDPEQEFVKVVTDIKRGTLSAYCDLHVDCAKELIEDGSHASDLWGANVFTKDNHIVYQSMINISPARGNRSMELKDETIREQMKAIIDAHLP